MTDAGFRRRRRVRLLARLLVVVTGLGLIGLCIAALEADPVPPMPRIDFSRSWAAARRFEEPDSEPVPAWNPPWNASAPGGTDL